MATKAMVLLKVFLALICAFHVIIGIGLNVSPEFPKTAALYYGAQHVNWTPEFVYILHPLGAFMFVLGALALVAAFHPLAYRPIIYAFSALFIIRGLQRIAFHADATSVFGISTARNMAAMAFFVGMGLALLALLFYVARHAGGTAAAAKRSDSAA